jgi:hypothetical protein
MKSTDPAERRAYSELVRPLVLVLATGLCALVASGCGVGSSETAAPPAPAPTETEATQTAPGREQVPTIEGTSIVGEPISLADYRGQAVLINVWSSW